jgi:hypothetical protein
MMRTASESTVWFDAPLFVHVIVAPVFTTSIWGEKIKSLIVTYPFATCGVVVFFLMTFTAFAGAGTGVGVDIYTHVGVVASAGCAAMGVVASC